MGEGFANSILGGAETLIRTAIKSAGYVAGIAGWRITKAGSAEFNDAVIRGTLTAGNGTVNITANSVEVIGGSAEYLIGSTTGIMARLIADDGSYFQAAMRQGLFGDSYGGIVVLEPTNPTGNGNTIDPGTVAVEYDTTGATDRPLMSLHSPLVHGLEFAVIDMWGQRSTSGTDDTQINLDANTVNIDNNFTIANVDGGRGTVSSGGMSANSAAIGNVETDLFTMSNFTFKAGRAYAIQVMGMDSVSVAGNRPLFRLRKSSGVQQLVSKSIYNGVAALQNQADWMGTFYVSGSDVNASPVVSVIGSAAFTVTVFGGYGAFIKDIGPASLVSGFATQLT